MSSPTWPLQVAVVARLKASPAVVALVGTRIHDGRAPHGEVKPYVVVGESDSDAFRTFGGRGSSEAPMLHVFTPANRQTGADAHAIADAIEAALSTAVSVAGWGAVVMREENRSGPLVEEDGTRHLPVRYRAAAFAMGAS
jgi:hypothetical protein